LLTISNKEGNVLSAPEDDVHVYIYI